MKQAMVDEESCVAGQEEYSAMRFSFEHYACVFVSVLLRNFVYMCSSMLISVTYANKRSILTAHDTHNIK